MRINSTGGNVVHEPLSFSFTMLELGGSSVQKFNAVSGSYVPNRQLTPYMLKPQLIIDDPEHLIAKGDYASSMVNVVWTVYSANKLVKRKLTAGTDYTLGSDNSLTFSRNVASNEVVEINFSADYLDKTRGKVQNFKWSKTLTTLEETSLSLSLELRSTSKVYFSPFKRYGQFPIEAVLTNGSLPVSADKCVYKWQRFDYEARNWVDIIDATDVWYVKGKDSGTIVVDVDFVQKVLLRVTAYPKSKVDMQLSEAVALRRWYGQWEDKPEFAFARFITKDLRKAKVEVNVANRQGIISQPQRYFDIELYYRPSAKAAWESLGNGTEAVISRDQMTDNHEVGDICRELSAFIPITMPNGDYIVAPDGTPICGQFPTSEKEGV